MSRSPLILALPLLLLAGCDRAADAPAQPVAGAGAVEVPAGVVERNFAGTALPAITVTDPRGQTLDLGAQDGPVLLNLWATWCPPCRDEMPALSSAAEAYADAGLELLAISVEEPAGDVEAFVDELDLRMRVLTDPRGRSMRQWAVFGLPTHYLVAPDGTIAWRWFGPLDPSEIERRAREAIGLDVTAGP